MSGHTHDGSEWPWPDPALGPPRPGLRPHLHKPGLLHGWVFTQHQVWVDFYGNEIEIECLPIYYVKSIILFCRRRALDIRNLVAAQRIGQAIEEMLFGNEPFDLDRLIGADEIFDVEPHEFLEQTPLMRALRRRIASKDRGRPRKDSGAGS